VDETAGVAQVEASGASATVAVECAVAVLAAKSTSVITFLGASIFNVVGGVPFLPLQTLWLNFTTQVFQAIGLGYGKPSEGLMARKPRPSDEPLLPRALLLWLGVYGLVMGSVTIGVAWIADDNHGIVVARTMALTTFALGNLFFSFACRDERRSVFSMDIFDDRRFLMMSGLSVVAIVLTTELRVLQRFLETTHLSFRQWLVCIGLGLLVVAVSEVRKVILRRGEPAGAPEATPEVAPTPAPVA
jgi:Ca2+-transporting ATPase